MKTLYDKEKVIAGLVIFVVLVSFPFWYNLGKAAPAPAPELKLTEKAKAAKTCVKSKEAMKTDHMQMLDEWREYVVRNGKRTYVAEDGKSYDMSLSNTCLDCHSNKADFCDKCHNYTSVNPYCWDCHIEKKAEESK